MKATRYLPLVLCLLLLACYEEPVRDHLHIVFAPGPAIVVTAVRDISPPGSKGENPAVEDRLDEARSDLDSGWDRWSRSFADLDAVADRRIIERHEGRARRGVHSALLDTFRPLERLLGNEGLGAYYAESGSVRELQLNPVGSPQATRQQRELLERFMTPWAEQVAAYLEASTALYAYLDEAPDRAIPCFAHIFDDHPEQSGPIGRDEKALVELVKEKMERVAEALLTPEDQAYSLNELSRLAHDSFQGRLTLAVDGPVLEIEGFTDHETFVERPPVDLWRALQTMVDRWLAPDLVTSMVVPGPENAQPEIDPVVFAGRPRRWSPPPDPWTVESELRAELQPEEVYRIRWRTRSVPVDEDEELELALELLASAERNLPDLR
jgi:hypothetical protein